jgi:glutamate:Na+ symporter, ESS family
MHIEVEVAQAIEIPAFAAVTCGIIVYFLGAFLTRHVRFLRDYNIPEPVVGGIAIAVATWIFFSASGKPIIFDLSVRDQLLVIFFTTLGLNARISDLAKGGRFVFTLLVLTVVFLIIQNLVGLLGTMVFELPAGMSVLVGSASLIGGHGTAIAWGPTITSATGIAAAEEVGIATATLGLVAAALVGGPIAKFLIKRHKLEASQDDNLIVGVPDAEQTQGEMHIDHINLMRAMLAVHITILLGYAAYQLINDWGLKLPLFVPCLLIGIILSNTIPQLAPKLPWPARTRALAVIADYSLSVFLSMSLMSMQLWTLSGLGTALIVILGLQILAVIGFVIFVVFRWLGGDYTSAVLCSGFAGFSLGATPTAIANMSAVTKHHGPAPMALIALPLVSAFFVDLVNAVVIQFLVAL